MNCYLCGHKIPKAVMQGDEGMSCPDQDPLCIHTPQTPVELLKKSDSAEERA